VGLACVPPFAAGAGPFSGGRDLRLVTALAVTMVGTGAAYIVQAQKIDSPAPATGFPFGGWVAFVTALKAALCCKIQSASLLRQ